MVIIFVVTAGKFFFFPLYSDVPKSCNFVKIRKNTSVGGEHYFWVFQLPFYNIYLNALQTKIDEFSPFYLLLSYIEYRLQNI